MEVRMFQVDREGRHARCERADIEATLLSAARDRGKEDGRHDHRASTEVSVTHDEPLPYMASGSARTPSR
jgi:hypothetical protein